MESVSCKVGHDDTQVVQLGMPGVWAIDSSEASDHYTSKVGGRPDWPPSFQPSLFTSDDSLKCAVCGGVLGLVAQVHAPLALPDGNQWNERTLYVFGCPASDCGVDPASWRSFRVQKEPLSGKPNSTAVNCGGGGGGGVGQEINCPSVETAGNDSGASECGERPSADWWDDSDLWGGKTLIGKTQQVEEEEFTSMNDLRSSLMEAGRLAAGIGLEDSRINRTTRGSEGGVGQGISTRETDIEVQNPIVSSPVLPCFYIYFQPESIVQKRITIPSLSSPGGLHTAAVHGGEGSEDHSGEVWEGEEYEPDMALHVDRTYLRFKKHLDHFPEQCFRYCHGGQVLWAAEDVREEAPAGQCVACGGPRVYEMQLMPSLLYFLQQAGTKASVGRSYSSEEWDWSTLIIFTCAQSCSEKASDECEKKEDWGIIEEATILQREVTKVTSFVSA